LFLPKFWAVKKIWKNILFIKQPLSKNANSKVNNKLQFKKKLTAKLKLCAGIISCVENLQLGVPPTFVTHDGDDDYA